MVIAGYAPEMLGLCYGVYGCAPFLYEPPRSVPEEKTIFKHFEVCVPEKYNMKALRLFPVHPRTPRSHLRIHHGFTTALPRMRTVAFRRLNREKAKVA